MTKRTIGLVHGPATGSSAIKVEVDEYNRVRLTIMTDFGETLGIFDKKAVENLIELLKETL